MPLVKISSPLVSAQEVQCPCFSIDDFNFLETVETNGSIDVDMERQLSCNPSDDGNRISLFWAYIAKEKRPDTRFSPTINGVTYKYFTANYNEQKDPSKEDLCGREDWLMGDLSPEVSKSCHDILRGTCEAMSGLVCPCFSLGDLEVAKRRIRDGELILDPDVSCTSTSRTSSDGTTSSSSSFYGLYQKSNYNSLGDPCDMCTTPFLVVDLDNGGCMNGSDIVFKISDRQALHCSLLMNETCADL